MTKNDRPARPLARLAVAAVVLATTAAYVDALSRIFQSPLALCSLESDFRFDDATDAPALADRSAANFPQSLGRTAPAWLMNALPGYSSGRAREQWYFSLDRSGDRIAFEMPPASFNAPVSNSYGVFNPALFNNVSPAAGFIATSSPKTSGVISKAASTTYTWEGPAGGAWNEPTNWSPSGFPNNQGDTALNSQSGTTSVNQDTSSGVTVGSILHGGSAEASWTIATTTPITMNRDGGGSFPAQIENLALSTAATNALIISGTGGLVLFDDLDVRNIGGSTNPSGAIQLSTPISGTGNVTFFNQSNDVNAGQIALLTANSFTGTVTIITGAVTFNDNASFGVSSNVINLGSASGVSSSLVSSAAISGMPNNIVVVNSTVGTRTLGGKDATQTNYTGTLRLNGNVTLTSASTVSGGTARTVAFTNTISGAGGVTVTGTSNSVGFVAFSASNTYQGGTTVNAGTLLVNNPINTSGTGFGAVTVNNSGTLGGSGVIIAGANNVTINGGGTITGGTNGTVAPAGAVGSLTLTATNVVFNGTSGNLATYAVDLTSLTSDRLAINGNLNLSTAFDQLTFDGTPAAASYTLATYTGTLTGIFDVVTPPTGYIVSYDIPGEIDLVAVPEPSTWIDAAFAMGAIGFTQRRKLRRLIRSQA